MQKFLLAGCFLPLLACAALAEPPSGARSGKPDEQPAPIAAAADESAKPGTRGKAKLATGQVAPERNCVAEKTCKKATRQAEVVRR